MVPQRLVGAATLALLLSVAACDHSPTAVAEAPGAPPAAPVVATVEVTPVQAIAWVGTQRQLAAVVRDSAGNVLTDRTISWRSANTTLATVSSAGVVTGRSVGVVTITATVDGYAASAVISVVPNITGRWAGTAQPIWFNGQQWSAGSFVWNLADPGTGVVTGTGFQTLSTNYQFSLELSGESRPHWIRLRLTWIGGETVLFDGRWNPGVTGSFCGTLIYPDGKLFPLCMTRQ